MASSKWFQAKSSSKPSDYSRPILPPRKVGVGLTSGSQSQMSRPPAAGYQQRRQAPAEKYQERSRPISDILSQIEDFASSEIPNSPPQMSALPYKPDVLRDLPPQRVRREDKSKSPGRERRHSPTNTAHTASSFAESRQNAASSVADGGQRRERSRDPKQRIVRDRLPDSGSDSEQRGQGRSRAISPNPSNYTSVTGRSGKSGPRDPDATFGISSKSIGAALNFGEQPSRDAQSQRSAGHLRRNSDQGSGLPGADDMMMQLQVQEALLDAAGFPVLSSDKYEIQKRELANLSAQVASLHSRLALESRVREAALNLTRLNSGNPEQTRSAQDQLAQANKKVDAIATELWKITGKLMEVERAVLKHLGGVLRWEVMKNRNGGGHGYTDLNGQDASGFTTTQKLASAEAKVRELEHMIDMLNNSIGRMEADQEPMKNELGRYQDQVRSLKEERDRLASRNPYNTPENTPGRGGSPGDSSRLKLELATTRAELAATKDELLSSRETITRLQVQHEDDSTVIEAKEREVANMGAELEEVTNQLDMHKEAAYAAAYTASKESPEARRAIAALQVQVATLENQLQKAKGHASRSARRDEDEESRGRGGRSRSRGPPGDTAADLEDRLIRAQDDLERAKADQARTERELQRVHKELSTSAAQSLGNVGRNGGSEKYSIDSLVKQVNRVVAENNAMGQKHGKDFSSTQQKMIDLQMEMSKIRSERDEYRRMLDETERKLSDEMRNVSSRHDMEMEKLKSRYDRDESDRGRRTDYRRDQSASRGGYEADSNDLRRRHNDELETLKKKYELEIDDLRERTELAERQAADVRAKADKEKDRLNNELDELVEELKKSKGERDDEFQALISKNKQYESAAQLLQQELRSAREKAEKMGNEMDDLKIQISTTTKRNREENEKLKAESAKRVKDVEAQLSEFEAIRAELASVDREHQILMARRETERREAEAMLKDAQDARDDALAKMDAMRKQLDKAQSEASEARNRPRSMAAEAQLIGKIDELQSTIIRLKEQKADLEDEVKEREIRERKAHRELDGIVKEMDRMTRNQTDFESERKRYENSIDKLRREVNDLQYRVQDYRLENVGGPGALDRYDGSTAASQKLRGEFKKMLADLRSEYNEQVTREASTKARLESELRDLKRERDMVAYQKVNDSTQTVLRWVDGDKPDAVGGATVGISNRDWNKTGRDPRGPTVTHTEGKIIEPSISTYESTQTKSPIRTARGRSRSQERAYERDLLRDKSRGAATDDRRGVADDRFGLPDRSDLGTRSERAYRDREDDSTRSRAYEPEPTSPRNRTYEPVEDRYGAARTQRDADRARERERDLDGMRGNVSGVARREPSYRY
ncbi:hypothetical protein SmJEL517_g01254 [Synchytrium microbalum]|uniref:Uncharacterized protein n=1 Tax=Synchytrium microbalum TaxID=1806994 RepID=A0A507CGF7_9FUNG|nr:uncharacterized protein SmJEL517_g01254 [Synchytrium microbalum]TPX36583.1 hypothetical protein SmJEL517_g01254 [Synchytrium microbalum]